MTITTGCQADAGSLLPWRDISIVALLAPISHKQMHLSLFTISPILPLTTHRHRAINAEEEQFIFIARNHSKHPRGLSVPPKSGREEAKRPPAPTTSRWVMLMVAPPHVNGSSASATPARRAPLLSVKKSRRFAAFQVCRRALRASVTPLIIESD